MTTTTATVTATTLSSLISSGAISIAPAATASRSVSGLAETSTIRAAPDASKWVSVFESALTYSTVTDLARLRG